MTGFDTPDPYLQLLLDSLVLLGFGDTFLFTTEIQVAYALVGQLCAGLCVVLVVLIVLVLCMSAQRCWHHNHSILQLLLGFFQVLLG